MIAHATAVVHPEARIAEDVELGPFAIIDAGARIAAGARIGGHVWITGDVVIAEQVSIHHGAVIGNEPQDLSFSADTASGVSIGPRTTIREYATVHRASVPGGRTRIGADCLLMAQAHVAHDVVIGDKVVICNNSLVPGHVQIDDRVFISGNVVIHQFCRIGQGVMIGGAGAVGQDVPPWTTVIGRSKIRALNIVGMRRAGLDVATRLEIKALYRAIFAERGDLQHTRAILAEASDRPAVQAIKEFYAADSRRGFCWPPLLGAADLEFGD